jgi:hypothetical protein
MNYFWKATFAICACVGAGVATTAAAGDFDGSKKLLCAPSDIYECAPASDCQRITPEMANIPRFIQVNVKKKRLSGTVGGGDKVTTGIQNVEKKDGKLTLQGAENARAWSVVIDQETGRMSASASNDITGFILFGGCTTSS